jgi:hypothetical protein
MTTCEFRARAGLRAGHGKWLVPPWTAPVFMTCAVLLIPWAAFLFADLITGTLLCCDAWFDVLTSRGASDITQAVLSAVLIELPLAALCFWIARNLARAMETAVPFLRAAGFTIRDNELVPPSAQATPGHMAAVE